MTAAQGHPAPLPAAHRRATLVIRRARVERREAEVGDLEVSVAVEQQVLGLEVAVADALVVAVLDAADELLEVEARGRLVEAALCNDLVEEFAASDELEHDEDLGEGSSRQTNFPRRFCPYQRP